jgi:glycosyltransferase involved in cell wall biosynthesis
MKDFNTSPFMTRASIPSGTQVVFVADAFSSDLTGGAELTSQALIDTSPLKIHCVRSHEVNLQLLEQGARAFWIFGNFARLDLRLVPTITANLAYGIIEYDYKYCRHRSPEKHFVLEGVPCDCANSTPGKMVSAFFLGSKHIWWMSEAQRDRYVTLFPFLEEVQQRVLSSVFSAQTLESLRALRKESGQRHGWARLESGSWIKGSKEAQRWCNDNGYDDIVIKDMTYVDTLKTLAQAKGLVYLPLGGDTCPRLVIEAKLLGCELHINDNVQHRHEAWFAGSSIELIEDYLSNAPSVFWHDVQACIERRPRISGYTTTLDCVRQGYPFEECIESMLGFCDQVVIVDGGSSDGTWERLQAMERADAARIVVVQHPLDMSDPRHALFDGQQKARARSLCTGDLCWQMDCDEVVHEEDFEKIRRLAWNIPRGIDLLSLPVIEYWGSHGKVRVDVQPWKWRLSRNLPNITHGIPIGLRRTDAAGRLCAAPGTDGCDMIDAVTGEPIPHLSFFTADVEAARRAALAGNADALRAYEAWFNTAVRGLPAVFHYSWYDISRKLRLYRAYWTRHWQSLYDQELPDTAENNFVFDVPWSAVTDAMIEDRAKTLEMALGGWVWHRKWDGLTTTPHMVCTRSQPAIMVKQS